MAQEPWDPPTPTNYFVGGNSKNWLVIKSLTHSRVQRRRGLGAPNPLKLVKQSPFFALCFGVPALQPKV